MNAASTRHGRLALAAAVIVTLGAIIGSASSLYRIGESAQLPLPLALPVALDLLAITAAAAVRHRRHDHLAWSVLVCATAVSTVLQVSDAPPDLRSQVVHGAIPVAALLAFELALRAMRPEAPAVQNPDSKTAKPRPRPRPAPPAPAEPEVKPTPIRPPRSDAQPLRPAAGVDDLVALAVDVAANLGKAPAELSRAELQAGVKAHPSRKGIGIGTAKAGQVLDHFRQRSAPELEVVR